jgi:predicted MFS family arabinose efflux permease
LSSRNYRLFFVGQSISLVGSWITRIATAWLVYRLTASELLLGVSGFCSQIPMLVLAPFTGVLCDRWNKHRILLVTQTLAMLQSATLAILALRHIITVNEVLSLQLFQGLINSFDTPARQSFIVQMVDDPKALPNAIALNSTMVNASRILGPSVGGLLIGAVGEGWCFAVDAISYLFVIASLLLMRLRPITPREGTAGLREEFQDGLRYVGRFLPVRTLLVQLGLVGLLSMPYTVLMPVIAARVLGGGPHTLGILMTAQGTGALLGALYLASRKSVLGLLRVITGATIAFGTGLVAFSLSQSLWLSVLILLFVNGGFMVMLASTNTILQTVVEERLRGRVMAFYAMAMLGTAPIGSLLGGMLAERIGAPHTILLGGLACLATTLWFALQQNALRKEIHPIYVRRGIIANPPHSPLETASSSAPTENS